MFIGLIDLIQFAPDLVAQFDRNIHLMNGYYTLIRFVVKIGSAAHVLTEIENGQNFRVITFGLIVILFILLIPIYLNDKSARMPIDIIGGIIFVIKSFTLKQK